MAKAETKISMADVGEALKRVGFEVLRPYLHTGHIPARHRGLYTSRAARCVAAPVTPRRRCGPTHIKTLL